MSSLPGGGGAASPFKKQVLPGDIVIQNLGPSSYVIAKVSGEEIGRSTDRLDAMRRACAAAREAGASAWICYGETSKTYHEVQCP